jgi:nitrate reductase assembly molybdenum cofactor insertion protein NarJ
MIPAPDGHARSDVQSWLEQSAAYLFASLALQLPDDDSSAALSSLVPSLQNDLQPLARAIVDLPAEDREPEYFGVLGPGGCPASESSYELAAMASRGPLLADVAGYYEAFAYRPPVRDVPDHAAVELGFAAYLALKVAFAVHGGRRAESAVARDALAAFRSDHLEPWIGRLCGALAASGSERYMAVAEYVSRACGGLPLE